MTTFVTIIFVIVSLVMVLAILLQAGKGGGMGTALGGTASGGVFGGGGQADFMAKLTQGFAAAFMICAMYLAYASAHSGSDFLEEEDKGGKAMFEDDQEINPELVGPNPQRLPTAEQAQQMQAAASVSVPAQTPTEAEPSDLADDTVPGDAAASDGNTNGQGSDSELKETAPTTPDAIANPNAPTTADAPADAELPEGP